MFKVSLGYIERLCFKKLSKQTKPREENTQYLKFSAWIHSVPGKTIAKLDNKSQKIVPSTSQLDKALEEIRNKGSKTTFKETLRIDQS